MRVIQALSRLDVVELNTETKSNKAKYLLIAAAIALIIFAGFKGVITLIFIGMVVGAIKLRQYKFNKCEIKFALMMFAYRINTKICKLLHIPVRKYIIPRVKVKITISRM